MLWPLTGYSLPDELEYSDFDSIPSACLGTSRRPLRWLSVGRSKPPAGRDAHSLSHNYHKRRDARMRAARMICFRGGKRDLGRPAITERRAILPIIEHHADNLASAAETLDELLQGGPRTRRCCERLSRMDKD